MSLQKKSLNSVLGPNGFIYSVPANAPYLIWINPATDVISYKDITSTLVQSGEARKDYFSFGHAIGNTIYYFPQEADKILKVTVNDVAASPTPTPTISHSATGPAIPAATQTPTISNTATCCGSSIPSPPSSPGIPSGCPVVLSPTPTPTGSATPTASCTCPVPGTPCQTTTQTPSNSLVVSITPPQTDTPTQTPTHTPTQTQSPTLTLGATPSNTATQTITPTAKVTSTPTPTGTPSFTPTPSVTSSKTFERCVSLKYNVVDGPDRFVVTYEDEEIFDSGFIGHSSYNFGGSKRQVFIDALIDLGYVANGFPGL